MVTERTFSINVPSHTENLAMIRDFVSNIGSRAGMETREVSQLELVVDEACANVIEHAYGSDDTQEVTVRVTVDDKNIQIEVIDTGLGFDPGSVVHHDLEKLVSEKKTGGLGMRLMKTLMDEVHYEIIPGKKNELRMLKKLKK